MRLCSEEIDLTDGVGLSEEKTFSLAEVRRHNTRCDAWMILNSKVYNVTRYLAYHPGSVEELMRAAVRHPPSLFSKSYLIFTQLLSA